MDNDSATLPAKTSLIITFTDGSPQETMVDVDTYSLTADNKILIVKRGNVTNFFNMNLVKKFTVLVEV